jgi:hypothetical protein
VEFNFLNVVATSLRTIPFIGPNLQGAVYLVVNVGWYGGKILK